LVEQRIENPCVDGSIPPLATKIPKAPIALRSRGFFYSANQGKPVSLPPCPKCQSVYAYEDGEMYVCPECAHEWSRNAVTGPQEVRQAIRDAVGNVLQDGDTVTVIKDLKVKGSSSVVKVGTKVKNIRLVDGDHDIDCKIDGIGAMGLKSEFVKKA
jgi:protein PhnA